MPNIVCVIPTIRPERHAAFVKAWAPLFEKHAVTLVTVWDGNELSLTVEHHDGDKAIGHLSWREIANPLNWTGGPEADAGRYYDLFCRRTDACRNLGFFWATKFAPDYVLTLDDDVVPVDQGFSEYAPGTPAYKPNTNDPIQAHLDALAKRVPISWMNTAHCGAEYLRGVPYGVREEAPVMLSHGVWVGTPDFDGETQLRLEGSPGGVPASLPYYVGPIPRGVLFPLCGMNVMVRKEALPYLYFAPMGPDSGVPDLHRFADIFMGCSVKTQFDRFGWAIYTGGAVVAHTRASDAQRNATQERLGRSWLEEKRVAQFWGTGSPVFAPVPDDESASQRQMREYFESYQHKRNRFADLIRSIQTTA